MSNVTLYCERCKSRPTKINGLCKACANDPNVPSRDPTKEEIFQNPLVQERFKQLTNSYEALIQQEHERYDLELASMQNKFEADLKQMEAHYMQLYDDCKQHFNASVIENMPKLPIASLPNSPITSPRPNNLEDIKLLQDPNLDQSVKDALQEAINMPVQDAAQKAIVEKMKTNATSIATLKKKQKSISKEQDKQRRINNLVQGKPSNT